ncbi:serine/threonine protein kinase [Streptomyces lunaelactis]|uniref:Serine/threonine protein kinase n=1 Tax=Streptomyces lunaelactis TaxID=1535768 RepID=A0A2R4TA16_9ACTN|nr:lipopolysaccharide kinase InaA family protein [Streptomyces lunaelactis]AVZ75963.1 serine/threonine protein kinase [Streptomyces lunaelactis]NUK89868.1 protein kinase [Streptomyces lunaelactis]NUL07688.1 protein kinase [Streptomyces lunaelactis]
MKNGAVIGGYRIVSEPTNANGGKCIWAFAERDGAQYFVKQFLEPKRPRDDDTRDTPSLRIRRELAREFEDRHRTIMERLRPDARGGGNLVLATDFFHEGSTYYKVTERIDTSSLEKPQALEPRPKTVLLKTLGMSLKQLHDINIVHGDLKPLNVLVQKRDGAAFHTAKLIDFDDSYVAGSPPGRTDVVGDTAYGAPEWRRYMQGDESVTAEHLTCAVDVFALGLMTHVYLTGALPGFDARFGSPADAVNAGEHLQLNTRLSDAMLGLLRAMTARAPGSRPRMATFLKALADPEVCALQHRRPGTSLPEEKAATGERPGPGGKPRTSRIKTNPASRGRPGGESSPATKAGPPPPRSPEPAPRPTDEPASGPAREPAAAAESAPPKPSRVRINLGDRGRRR